MAHSVAGMIQEMQDYYRLRAPVYDQSMGYDNPDEVVRLAPAIEHISGLLAQRTVIEVACGPCFWTRFFSRSAHSVLATDFNRSTLEQASLKELPWDRVSLGIADAYNLPYFGRQFDAAYAGDWLAHVPKSKMHRFLEGLHRCLRDGSRVVFCDQLPGNRSFTGIVDAEGNHVQERILPDGSRYRVIKHFMTDGEIQEVFAPYADSIEIRRIPECRRLVISYNLAQ